VKALSIKQPFASLIVGWADDHGARHDGPKPIENRSRMMGGNLIGERIAIHASKAEDDSVGASLLGARWIFNAGGVELSAWRLGGWTRTYGRAPKNDDLLVPPGARATSTALPTRSFGSSRTSRSSACGPRRARATGAGTTFAGRSSRSRARTARSTRYCAG
jgi:hypothetical protein